MSPGRLRTIIVSVSVIVVLLVGVLVYALIGNSIASNHITAADNATNATIGNSRQVGDAINSIKDTFASITGTHQDPKAIRSLATVFVESWKTAGTTAMSQDDALAASRYKLNDQQWLTIFSRGKLDTEGTRIDHARKALAAIETISTNAVKDALFLPAYADTIDDLDAITTTGNSKDFVGLTTAVGQLKVHVDVALGLAGAPGFPPEVRQYMLALQTLAVDLATLLNAAAAGDTAGYDAAKAKLTTDTTDLSNVSLDQVPTEIVAFYQPYIDTYHRELNLASG